jgi:Zn-finger nucleic acid-binding protein
MFTGLGVINAISPDGYLQKILVKVKQHGDLSPRECPSCLTRMTAVTLPDVQPKLEIDFCLHCQSVWFDKNELGQLPKKSSEEKRQDLEEELQKARVQLDKYYAEVAKEKSESAQRRHQWALVSALIRLNS